MPEFTLTPLATDDFNRADESDINAGATWDASDAGGGLNLVSNHVVQDGTALNFDSGSVYAGGSISWPMDQYAEVAVGGLEAAGVTVGPGLFLRYQAGTFYIRVVVNSTTMDIGVSTGGSPSVSVKTVPSAFVNGDVLRAVAYGRGVFVYRNGVLVVTADIGRWPVLSNPTFPGMFYSSPFVSSPTWDNWAAGSVVAVDATRTPSRLLFPKPKLAVTSDP